ncbi:hypothetical protein SERLA73DRAFT_188681 [Serpula lacrymans var. lacrymans S7.3]|uniref:Brl1/Brr6 domain-containing protein n=2 Tax=Serpula lacrymans var. lacrymans TaxID=341189 RepID=F8QBY0_SERL3|nr:uncharacterized protein SERLADRAFT_479026 [Serpula lacrymans var. lacrymans S7.9]EGN94099.1 hypothetical protein SERLA73DRAFT_188681 [Serpula lacrymans var. lacrymans S7.3]EGO19510.1 hypothetical protein SERLADRAFT_479026 [Serpula lacrymans var. lacrymans S7.9]
MNRRLQNQRSTEAPMDFQFTSRPSSTVRPVWATSDADPNTPRKRPFGDLNPSTPSFPAPPNTPIFGENRNVPFIFQTPAPQPPAAHPWEPPSDFSPQKAFPAQEELKDIDMSELSPDKAEEKEGEGGRAVATGALRRVFKSRQKARDKGHLAVIRHSNNDPRDSEESDSEEHGSRAAVSTQSTSNHYTLNMPSVPLPHSDTPYILLGYLQFFFNLSLVLVFLYLVLQFILTVQRDVEQRISEYSMDIVQEIAMCASQYKDNLCASNPVPAMLKQCATWGTCMNRDPTVVGRARVGAELIAEVVNGFVEPISWKTLAFTLTSLSFLTVFVNTLLSLYRSRHQAASHPHPPYPVAPFPQQIEGYRPSGPAQWNRVRHGNDDRNAEEAPRRRRLEGGQAAKIKS